MIELTRLWPDDDKRDDALVRCLVDVYRAEGKPPPPYRLLSPQQLRAIECASRGLDSDAAGVLLGITGATVREHWKYARRKLRAKNTTHACCEALRQGLIR